MRILWCCVQTPLFGMLAYHRTPVTSTHTAESIRFTVSRYQRPQRSPRISFLLPNPLIDCDAVMLLFAHDPLVAHADPIYRARRGVCQRHQVGAALAQHGRNQKCQVLTLRVALLGQPLMQYHSVEPFKVVIPQ